MIRCRLCGSPFERISASHLRTHNTTMAEYRSRFPQALLYSKRALDEHRAKMQAEFTKPERRAQILQASQYQQTDEGRQRAAKHFKRLWTDPEYRKKMHKRSQETWSRPEHRQKLSRKTSESWKDPATRERRLGPLRKAVRTPEYREAAAERSRLRWRDPVERAKALAGLNSARNKERMRQHSRALWQDPERKQRLLTARSKTNRKKWTKPERIVRGWLKRLGLYHKVGGQFRPHQVLHRMEVDFLGYGIVIQVDGNYWHGSSFPQTQLRDRLQEFTLRREGYIVLRFRERDVHRRPQMCLDALQTILTAMNVAHRKITK